MSVETASGSSALGYPALGFDPAPGATEQVGSLAAELRSVATELGAAHQTLVGIGRSSGIWQGEAAQAFHDKLGELPDYLGKANRSLGDAAVALNQWSTDLASMQMSAAQYEAEAAQALQHLRAAESNPDLGLAGQVFSDDTALAQAQARYDAAISQVDTASKELAAIRALAQRLLAQHGELASDVADALRRAKDEAPEEPSLFDRIGEFVDGIKDLASAALTWVQGHADLIAQFGGLMSKVSTALGVLAIITAPFEPVGAIFAGAAAGTSLMALGAHGLAKAAGVDVGWGSMVGDALGALPFIGGVAGRGAKVAAGAERALGAGRQNVLDYAASRAEEIGGEVAKKSTEGAKRAFAVIKADGVAGRFHTGIEAAYQNVREGPAIGTKGLNWTIDKLGGRGGIDPLSVGGRALDAGIKGGKLVAAEVYHHLTGADGPPPSASSIFCSRVAARGAA
ncbi:MAG: hypothetical protein JO281_23820 [Pseudonocardiales bacterium]|nr:hypothetical protein [Pseudonocardiales bacterium]